MRHPNARPSARAAARSLLAALALSPSVFAADFYKANNETNLDLIAAWENLDGTAVAAAPVNSTSSTDTWIWDSRVTAAADTGLDGIQNVTVSAAKDLGVRTIRMTNPALPVVFDGNGRTFTPTSSGGVDMSTATQNLTLQNMFYRVASSSATINMNVAAGRTLTFGSTAQVTVRSNGSNVLVNLNTDGTSSGTIIFNNIFNPSHVVIGAGRVEFNNAAGTTRIATASPNPVSYTNVNGGTLVVNNTSGSATGDSIVNVNSGGTLTGAGKITGSTNSIVNANSGSTIVPGNNGVGTLSIGRLALAGGSKIIWEASNSSAADLIAVTTSNGLTLNGGVVSLYNPGTTEPLTATGTFTLFTYSGTLNGALTNLSIDPTTQIAGRIYTLANSGTAITLTIATEAAIERSWDVDASGTWSTAVNWTADTVPDAIGTIANITGPAGAAFTAPRTITLDAPRTVGALSLASAQSVILDGSASLTLNNNAATAPITSSGASHVINAPIVLTAGGMLADVAASTTLTLGGVVEGAGLGLVKASSGTLLLTADNTYSGVTSVSGGVLQIGNGGATGSVAGPIATSGSIRFNRSDAVTLGQAISGTGSVEFAGVGVTTLSVANTYSGATTLSAGGLVLGNSLALQNSTLTYSTSGGSLSIADTVTSLTLGGLAGDRAFPLTNANSTAIALAVGQNNASTTYSGSPLGTGSSFTKAGSGTLTLTGNHTYSGNTTVNAGILSIDTGATFNTGPANLASATAVSLRIGGGTLNATSALVTNASGSSNNATVRVDGLLVTGGAANFTGNITNETNSTSGGALVSVSGGELNAANLTLSRGSLIISSEPASGQVINGLYVNGGAARLSGNLSIGANGTNSSVSARMDAGSLTVDGTASVGINNATGNTRWSVLDINGGTFTVNGANGLVLGSPYTGTGNQTFILRKSTAVANLPRIQFGAGAQPGKSVVNLLAGTLYLGAGGMVVGSTDSTFLGELRLTDGVVGASADWSSPIAVNLVGSPSVVTGADAANAPHVITLSGAATGLGSLAKRGAGTVLFTSSANDYYGPTIVEAGVLGLAGKTTDLVTVNSGATLRPIGVLTTGNGVAIEGALAVEYADSAVSRLENTAGQVALGTGSSLTVTGTGALANGTYLILKSAGGVTGTFGTTSLPAGCSVNYNYDDDNDTNTPPSVALVVNVVVSPYDTWTSSFGLSGGNALASADPDADGLPNLIEFAFSTSPVAANAAPWTVARSGNFLTLSFAHPADSGLTYAVEATSDLAAGTWTTVQTYPAFTSAGTTVFTDTVDLSAAGTRRFLRLKVTPAP